MAPTPDALLEQLRYPDEFSSTMSTVFFSLVGVVAFCWVVLVALYYARKEGYIHLPSDKQYIMAGVKGKSQKKKFKKFEDYWDDNISDDSLSKFPNRTAAANSFDDYWEDLDLSFGSTDRLTFAKTP